MRRIARHNRKNRQVLRDTNLRHDFIRKSVIIIFLTHKAACLIIPHKKRNSFQTNTGDFTMKKAMVIGMVCLFLVSAAAVWAGPLTRSGGVWTVCSSESMRASNPGH